MKRAMTTSVVAGLLGTLGFAPAVSAEGTLYGSVRSGVYMLDPQDGGSTTWDLGSVDAGDLGSGDKLWSRIGVRASTELDGGVTAGLHLEKRLDNFRTRHQNVWVSGDFGKLTLGQQGSVYNSGVSWDNTNLFGNWNGIAGGTRLQGISYTSNLGGPFNFGLMISDDNSGGGGNGQGVDAIEASGTISAAGLSIGAGYDDDDTRTVLGFSVGGSFGAMGWDTGYEIEDADNGMDRTGSASPWITAPTPAEPMSTTRTCSLTWVPMRTTCCSVTRTRWDPAPRSSRSIRCLTTIRVRTARPWSSGSTSDRNLYVVSHREDDFGAPFGAPFFCVPSMTDSSEVEVLYPA